MQRRAGQEQRYPRGLQGQVRQHEPLRTQARGRGGRRGAAARKNASKECKAEASDPNFEATHQGKSFAEYYGANGNGKNAHGKCVSAKAKELKADMDKADAEEAEAFKNAAKACAAERRSLGTDEFADKYGTNPNKRNAFGKCVSKRTSSDT